MDKAISADETKEGNIGENKKNNDLSAIEESNSLKKETKPGEDIDLLKFLEKVDKAAAVDGGVDKDVTDTIKTWMKELKK